MSKQYLKSLVLRQLPAAFCFFQHETTIYRGCISTVHSNGRVKLSNGKEFEYENINIVTDTKLFDSDLENGVLYVPQRDKDGYITPLWHEALAYMPKLTNSEIV